MIEVKQLDKQLSHKIGDPREDNGAGEVFSNVERLDYLKNAYSRLSRMLNILMRGHQPEWNTQREVITFVHSGIIITTPPPIRREEE